MKNTHKKINNRIRIFAKSILMITLYTGVLLEAKSKLDVQYIAVHFGNPEHAQVIDTEQFAGFEFYTAPGNVYGYTEEQKIIGNPVNLVGWYGEVPEKMGFGANYTIKKYFSFPHADGVFYVVDHNGVIAYQSPSDGHFDRSLAVNKLKKTVKKMAKGKGAKALKAKKCKYLKSAPVGELETVKKSKIDKDQIGLTGWAVPDIAIIDANGNTTTLSAIAKGKVTVVVFYTLNGVHWKRGDKKGAIVDEWDGQVLINSKTYREIKNASVMADVEKTKSVSAVTKSVGKDMFQSALAARLDGAASITAGLLYSSKELDDAAKAQGYAEAIAKLELVQSTIK